MLEFNVFLPYGYKISEADLIIDLTGSGSPLHVREIHLHDSLLNPMAISSIATTLVQHADSLKLTVLRLARNPQLGDEGLIILATALPLTLIELSLERTSCTCVGLQAVAKKLPLLTTLRKLNLANNGGINQDGWNTLGHTLTQMRSLTELHLFGCCGMKCVGAGAVVADIVPCVRL